MKETTMNVDVTKRQWYLIDAKEKTVGRLAVKIANMLRGKNKPNYVPHQDCGDYVVVINSRYVKFTGKKWENKIYYSHSTKPGKLKERPAAWVHEKDPTKVLYKAVKGMLQKNKIAARQLTRLKIFPDSEHSLMAQKPQRIDFPTEREVQND